LVVLLLRNTEMTEVLAEGTSPDVVKAPGTYLVVDPDGLDAGSYILIVVAGGDAAGDNYCYQRALDITTGVEYTRSEEATGWGEWVSAEAGPAGATGPTGPAGPTGPSGEGGGGVVLEGISTSGITTEVQPEDDEVRYEIMTGATEGPENILIGEGQYTGQRVVFRLATLTDAEDSVVFDMSNIRINSGAPVFAGGTEVEFSDVTMENPALAAVGDFLALRWYQSTLKWHVIDLFPTPPSL
jgi:hypothetical protein